MPGRDGDTATIRRGPGGRTPASIAARLTYENVTHRYGDVVAVRDFSLDIGPGEIVCLLGRSGCGKTTLLRLAAGVEEPASGRILINDREVSGDDRYLPPERRGVGLMFQDFALFPHLTNLANVMFGLKAMPKADAEREARFALARVGLTHLADVYPHMLSGGEQQRVALARAVAPRPSVLLMDEPFSGLDRRLRDEVRDDTLNVLRESRVTCVIVTHDPEEALRMADRVALMREGRLVQVDTPEGIYLRPANLFVGRFFCELNEVDRNRARRHGGDPGRTVCRTSFGRGAGRDCRHPPAGHSAASGRRGRSRPPAAPPIHRPCRLDGNRGRRAGTAAERPHPARCDPGR